MIIIAIVIAVIFALICIPALLEGIGYLFAGIVMVVIHVTSYTYTFFKWISIELYTLVKTVYQEGISAGDAV